MARPDKRSSDGSIVEPLRKTRPCPLCEKPSNRDYYPFCSRHCADLDLSRWLKGSYAVPAEEEDLPYGDEPDDTY